MPWRKARKVNLPESLNFLEFWEVLFCIFLVLCNLMTGPKPRFVELIHSLFSAVDHMRESDFLTATIVISPTSPKRKGESEEEGGGGHLEDGSPVPVSVAERGLGVASSVPIPLDMWQSLVHLDSL